MSPFTVSAVPITKAALEKVVDLSGTPANGSVGTEQFAAANIDGAAGVPSARTLDTDSLLAANSDSRVSSQKAIKAALAVIGALKPMIPPSGNFLVPWYTGTGETVFATKEQVIYLPVDLGVAQTIKSIACQCQTKGEGTALLLRMGVYADDGTGTKPKALLHDFGTISAEATGERAIEAEHTYGPGRIWVAHVIQGTLTVGPKLTSITSVAGLTLGVTNLGNNSPHGLKQTGVSGALPAEATPSSEPIGTVPLVGLKVK
jgi:hypothetical protein